MTAMDPQTIHLVPGDEIVLKYLGAAVVLQWENLSKATQESLLQQAHSIGGLPVLEDLQENIRALIARSRT